MSIIYTENGWMVLQPSVVHAPAPEPDRVKYNGISPITEMQPWHPNYSREDDPKFKRGG